MSYQNLKERTKTFALEIIKFVDALPNDRTSRRIGDQLLRAGTSVGANYRSAARAKSPADFISKMGIVEEEADESAFWLDLLLSSRKVANGKATALLKEADELTAIAVSSIRTARRSASRSKPRATRSLIRAGFPKCLLRTKSAPRSALRIPRVRIACGN